MGNLYVFILVVASLVWMVSLFFGLMTGVSKSFRQKPNPSSVQAEKLKDKERKLAEETEEKRRQLMENTQQRIRDSKKF